MQQISFHLESRASWGREELPPTQQTLTRCKYKSWNMKSGMIVKCAFRSDGCVVPLGPTADTGVHNPNGYTLNYNGEG